MISNRLYSSSIRVNNLIALIDGYFANKGTHLTVRILNRNQFIEAIEYPERYPQLYIKLSGTPLSFHDLSKDEKYQLLEMEFPEKPTIHCGIHTEQPMHKDSH